MEINRNESKYQNYKKEQVEAAKNDVKIPKKLLNDAFFLKSTLERMLEIKTPKRLNTKEYEDRLKGSHFISSMDNINSINSLYRPQYENIKSFENWQKDKIEYIKQYTIPERFGSKSEISIDRLINESTERNKKLALQSAYYELTSELDRMGGSSFEERYRSAVQKFHEVQNNDPKFYESAKRHAERDWGAFDLNKDRTVTKEEYLEHEITNNVSEQKYQEYVKDVKEYNKYVEKWKPNYNDPFIKNLDLKNLFDQNM